MGKLIMPEAKKIAEAFLGGKGKIDKCTITSKYYIFGIGGGRLVPPICVDAMTGKCMAFNPAHIKIPREEFKNAEVVKFK